MLTLFALSFAINVKASPLGQDELTNKAINQARILGLKGDPTAQKTVQMSYAEWLKLNDTELGENAKEFGLTPDMPVFILAMRGDVARQMPLGPSPEKIEGERFDNITIVLNANTGEVMGWSVSPSADLMPVKVD